MSSVEATAARKRSGGPSAQASPNSQRVRLFLERLRFAAIARPVIGWLTAHQLTTRNVSKERRPLFGRLKL